MLNLLSILPFCLYGGFLANKQDAYYQQIITLFFYFRLIELKKIFTDIIELLYLNDFYDGLQQLLNLIINVFITERCCFSLTCTLAAGTWWETKVSRVE